MKSKEMRKIDPIILWLILSSPLLIMCIYIYLFGGDPQAIGMGILVIFVMVLGIPVLLLAQTILQCLQILRMRYLLAAAAWSALVAIVIFELSPGNDVGRHISPPLTKSEQFYGCEGIYLLACEPERVQPKSSNAPYLLPPATKEDPASKMNSLVDGLVAFCLFGNSSLLGDWPDSVLQPRLALMAEADDAEQCILDARSADPRTLSFCPKVLKCLRDQQ